MENILGSDESLAYEWLSSMLECEETYDLDADVLIEIATQKLQRQQRKSLLKKLRKHSYWAEKIVQKLVGNDTDLYVCLLNKRLGKYIHFAPLQGNITKSWGKKAKLALNAGYSAIDVSRAVLGTTWGWDGNESEMWAGWMSQFERLRKDTDIQIQTIGEAGLEWSTDAYYKAKEREENEEVYGI